jgi:uncharacterized Zn-binding protein involved in type VI secretion
VNKRGACRLGDKDSDSPPDSTVQGSPNVFVNKKTITRIGDKDNDFPPDTKIEGSQNVFANGA